MNVKILKNKKFYIPTERIKEAKAGAEKEEKLIQRIDNMTDEEYDAYIEAELAKADEQIANGQLISYEEFIQELREYDYLLEKEEKNYQNWKKFLVAKRGEKRLRNIL